MCLRMRVWLPCTIWGSLCMCGLLEVCPAIPFLAWSSFAAFSSSVQRYHRVMNPEVAIPAMAAFMAVSIWKMMIQHGVLYPFVSFTQGDIQHEKWWFTYQHRGLNSKKQYLCDLRWFKHQTLGFEKGTGSRNDAGWCWMVMPPFVLNGQQGGSLW